MGVKETAEPLPDEKLWGFIKAIMNNVQQMEDSFSPNAMR